VVGRAGIWLEQLLDWNTTGLATGTYTRMCTPRRELSATYDTYLAPAPTYTLQVQGNTCTSVSETASPPSPQASGTAVQLHGDRHRLSQPNYQFWLLPPGGAWSVVQAYGSSNTWSWSTGGLAAGTYMLDVYARDASSTAVTTRTSRPTRPSRCRRRSRHARR